MRPSIGTAELRKVSKILIAPRLPPGKKPFTRRGPQHGHELVFLRANEIPLPTAKVARATDQPDGLIDPVGMNADRAIRRFVDGLIQPGKVTQLSDCYWLDDEGDERASARIEADLTNPSAADQSIDVELKPKPKGYPLHVSRHVVSIDSVILGDAFHLQ